MRDTPAYDLVLAMDAYDLQEVVREVAVLERLNPGGAYLTRLHRLCDFARAGPVVFKDRCLLVGGVGSGTGTGRGTGVGMV